MNDEHTGTGDRSPDHQTDWSAIKAITDEDAHRNAIEDPDNPPLTRTQLSRLRRVPNPLEIRQRLNLTQRDFARQFQIALGTLRDWEQGISRPDSTAKAYLRVIDAAPDSVRRILDVDVTGRVHEAASEFATSPDTGSS